MSSVPLESNKSLLYPSLEEEEIPSYRSESSIKLKDRKDSHVLGFSPIVDGDEPLQSYSGNHAGPKLLNNRHLDRLCTEI